MVEIKNAEIHTGYITYIHAKALDQDTNTFNNLPGAKEIYGIFGQLIKVFDLDERTVLFLS